MSKPTNPGARVPDKYASAPPRLRKDKSSVLKVRPEDTHATEEEIRYHLTRALEYWQPRNGDRGTFLNSLCVVFAETEVSLGILVGTCDEVREHFRSRGGAP
jgi:hypothetical protein